MHAFTRGSYHSWSEAHYWPATPHNKHCKSKPYALQISPLFANLSNQLLWNTFWLSTAALFFLCMDLKRRMVFEFLLSLANCLIGGNCQQRSHSQNSTTYLEQKATFLTKGGMHKCLSPKSHYHWNQRLCVVISINRAENCFGRKPFYKRIWKYIDGFRKID